MRKVDRLFADLVPPAFALVFLVAGSLEAVGVPTGEELKALGFFSLAVFWLHMWAFRHEG
jgi:hypothetical protein